MIIALGVCRMNSSCGWQRSSCLFDDWMSYSCLQYVLCCIYVHTGPCHTVRSLTAVHYHILWDLSQLFTITCECMEWHMDVYMCMSCVFTSPFALFLLPLYSPPPQHTPSHNTHTDNRPPNITGQLTVRVNVNVSLEETYLAEDQDEDDIHTFILQVNIHCKWKLLSHDFC